MKIKTVCSNIKEKICEYDIKKKIHEYDIKKKIQESMLPPSSNPCLSKIWHQLNLNAGIEGIFLFSFIMLATLIP